MKLDLSPTELQKIITALEIDVISDQAAGIEDTQKAKLLQRLQNISNNLN